MRREDDGFHSNTFARGELAMKTHHFSLVATLAVTTMQLVGCGGESVPENRYSSGLPPASVLGNLTDSDAQSLCMSTTQYLFADPVVANLQCKLVGGIAAGFEVIAGTAKTDAEVQTACTKTYDQCKTSLGGDAGAKVSCRKPKQSCTATIAEYEACTTDIVSTYHQLDSQFPACKDLKLSDIRPGDAGAPPAPQSPPSCTVLMSKCPEFGSSGGSGDAP
jgi:hypothetical protein